MKKSLRLTLLFSLCVLVPGLAGDSPEQASPKGFRFPGGEVEAGRETFTKLSCIKCHSVAKTEFPALKEPRRIELELAREVRFVRKYEDIITAVTNPKHVLNENFRELLTKNELAGIEPLMPDLTKDMSARQLMDIVTFLDQAYSKSLPGYGGK